jgi:hypothetical protein
VEDEGSVSHKITVRLPNLIFMRRYVLLSLVLVLVAFTSFAVGHPTSPQSQSHATHQFNYPIAFERNTGQTHRDVKFISQRLNYRVFLTPKNAVFVLDRNPHPPPALESTRSTRHSKPDSLRLHLVGANQKAVSEGRKKLPSYSNYLIGSDPRKWRANVPQFAEVWSPAIYPGIDLVYYANEGQLEYDFIVAPGANPDRIEFSISESESGSRIRVNEHGDLIIPNRDGEALFHKPRLYQGKSCSREKPNHAADEPGCKALNGGEFHVQHAAHSGVLVSFRLPAYDHTQPLVIDPAVSFSTFLGGSGGDGVNRMTLDSAGNIYLFGITNSPDFPITAGAYQTNLPGNINAFVTKLSSDGSQIIYSTYLGGNDDETPKGMAIDSANNVYLTGQTMSKDFPVVNAFQSQSKTFATGFVSKLSADGTKLIYSTFLGGSSSDNILGVAVDPNNEAIVVGTTTSLDYPLVNALQPTCPGCPNGGNAVVSKFSADGSALLFSTYFGGESPDEAVGVALDPSDNVYFTGYTETNFPTTPNAFQTTCNSNVQCVFVTKLDASGQNLMYSGVLDDGFGTAIAVNSAGNAFITGYAGLNFPVTPGAFQSFQGGGWDAFVTEVDTTGSSLVYSTDLGGNNADYGWAIALDSSNNAYVTGQTDSTNFPLQDPLQAVFYQSIPSVFVSELNSTGSALLFSTYWGGGAGGYGSQQGNAIALDSAGSIYFAGSTLVPDFPVVNPIQSQLLGPGDAFIAEFEVVPDFTFSGTPSTATVTAGQTANYSLTLTPLNGFNQQISLTCSGAPLNSTCSVSPPTLTLDGVHTGNPKAAVVTSPRSASMLGPGVGGNVLKQARNLKFALSASFALFGLCFAGSVSRGRSRTRILSTAVLLVLGSLLLVSCGSRGSSGGDGGTPAGTYTIKVVATSGNLSHSENFTLTVN